MRFYLVEVTQYLEPVNDRTETFSMNGYDEERLAKSYFHLKMSTAMRNDNVKKEICARGVMIIEPEVYEYVAPPEPEPQPEQEGEPEGE